MGVISARDLILKSDFVKQLNRKEKSNKIEDYSERVIQNSKPKKSSRPQDKLTDYQRLRAQGSISPYSTRILDKMPKRPKKKPKDRE